MNIIKNNRFQHLIQLDLQRLDENTTVSSNFTKVSGLNISLNMQQC